MGVSITAYIGLLLAVGLGRLVEMRISARHQRQLCAQGVVKVPERNFRWMVLLHTGVLVSAGLEVVLFRRPLIPRLALAMGLLFVLANGLRWWVMTTLSEHWNVQARRRHDLNVPVLGQRGHHPPTQPVGENKQQAHGQRQAGDERPAK